MDEGTTSLDDLKQYIQLPILRTMPHPPLHIKIQPPNLNSTNAL
jgi:hypothetical protein